MRDLAYVTAGYLATGAAVGGYRWRLAVRMRHARQYAATLRGRDRSGR